MYIALEYATCISSSRSPESYPFRAPVARHSLLKLTASYFVALRTGISPEDHLFAKGRVLLTISCTVYRMSSIDSTPHSNRVASPLFFEYFASSHFSDSLVKSFVANRSSRNQLGARRERKGDLAVVPIPFTASIRLLSFHSPSTTRTVFSTSRSSSLSPFQYSINKNSTHQLNFLSRLH